MKHQTAAILVIGNEVLSGRTRDANAWLAAQRLFAQGCRLEEIAVVPDRMAAIIDTLNRLRGRYEAVITSGGIGPTHDDITADAIAAAFEVAIGPDPRAMAILGEHYAERGLEFTDARKRMARMPRGANHIENPVSIAPGFNVENVYVMAGVPSVFQAMLGNVLPTLKTGAKLISKTVHCPHPEGAIGGPLGEIQKAHPLTVIGSYPKFRDGKFWTELVIRARSTEALDPAVAAVEAMIAELASR